MFERSLNQLALDLPHRAREIIDMTAAGRLMMGVKLTQAESFIGAIHKIANRITVGLIIAAIVTMYIVLPTTTSLERDDVGGIVTGPAGPLKRLVQPGSDRCRVRVGAGPHLGDRCVRPGAVDSERVGCGK